MFWYTNYGTLYDNLIDFPIIFVKQVKKYRIILMFWKP